MIATFLAVMALGLSAQPMEASGTGCTRDQAIQALTEAGKIRSFRALHQSYVRYGACDTGAIAEGYSQSVEYLVTEKWGSLPGVADELVNDSGFQAFVISHVDELWTPESLERARTLATTRCPARLDTFCAGVREAAGQ